MFFGKNIKYLRALKGMTQGELAGAMEVNPATVTGWETGKSFPHFQVFLELGKFFQVDLESLVYRDLQKAPQERHTLQPIPGEENSRILELLVKLVDRTQTLEDRVGKIEGK